MKAAFLSLCQRFDQALHHLLDTARADGTPTPTRPVHLRIVGQMALLLSDVPFPVASTTDLDVLLVAEYQVTQLLQQHLATIGLTLESDRHLIWMPAETTYDRFYESGVLQVDIAAPRYVIASKCRFQRARDRRLIAEYFAVYPQQRAQIEAMGIATQWIDV